MSVTTLVSLLAVVSLLAGSAPRVTAQEPIEPTATFEMPDTEGEATVALPTQTTSSPVTPTPPPPDALGIEDAPLHTATPTHTPAVALPSPLGVTDVVTTTGVVTTSDVVTASASQHLYVPLVAVSEVEIVAATAEQVATPVAEGEETAEPTPSADPWLEAVLAQMEAAEAVPALYTVEEETALREGLTFTATVAESGGLVSAFGGRLEVRLAANAAEEALVVTVRPAVGQAAPPYSLSLWPFEIVAEGVESGAEVRQFKQPLEIVLFYEEEWIQGDEESLYLFYFHEEEKSWLPLPSQVDAEKNVLIAHSDHLTVFDFDIQNWEAARLPSLERFQIGSFTGAAQYSYDFTLPPGPGGWAPQLTLSYNSQVVDAANNRTQADWVGMGWSLETGYIERSMRGSDTLSDDVFVLMLNGATYRLLPDGSGGWRTEEDTFLHIQYNGNPDLYGDQDQYWTVWDKEGNKYLFGGPETHRATYPRNAEKWTWRWLLRAASNRFGQEISYSYAYEGVARNCGTIQASAGGNDVAVYPAEILYPNGKYRVRFERIARNDYETGWLDPCASVRFQRSLLKRIVVEHHNGTGWEMVRRYELDYNDQILFPGVVWGMGGRTPALVKIQEFDAGGNSLPATTFEYGDAMHLTAAENGYKGRVEFNYTLWSSSHGPGGDDAVQSGGRCSAYSWGTNGQTETICSSSSGSSRGFYFKAQSGATHGHVHTANYFRIFRPGGAYRIVSKLERWNRDPHEVRIGLNHGGGIVWDAGGQFRPLNSSGETLFDSTIVLPTNASRMWLTYEGNAILRVFVGYDTLSRYRVTQKRIIDRITNTMHVFDYSYDEPAVNDPLHSALLQQVLRDDWICCRDDNVRVYVEPFTEFRGHALVRERGPDGRIRYSWHRQDDVRKGKTVRTQEGWEEFYSDFTTSAGWASMGEMTQPPVQGDPALRLNNPATSWQVFAYRTVYGVQDGEMAQLQFRIANTGVGTPMAVLALESEEGRRWGIYVKSDRSVVVQRNDGGSFEEVYTLVGANGFEYDQWYVLQLGVDSTDIVRLWKRDAAPESDAVRRWQGNYVAGARNWRFRSWISAGALVLDTYSELRLWSETENHYAATETASWLRTRRDGKPLLGVKAYWLPLSATKTLHFGGDATFVGTMREYLYDPALQGGVQYGNITNMVERAWNGSAFVAYRATQRVYYPRNEATRYVVGLPGREIVFRCPGGTCSYHLGDAVQTRHLIYDNQPFFWSPPLAGALTRERQLVCYATSSNQCTSYGAAGQTRQLMRDVRYSYDAYGNLTGVTTSSDYGYHEEENAVYPSTNLRTTTYTYADNGYNTYRTGEQNALGHTTSWVYNYRLGVPVQETDPNGITTFAEYDGFGRLTKLIRPG
jgi:YD repeat-containing protein